MSDNAVTIVGAGLSGIACARALAEGGIPTRILERGRVPGGRLATKRFEERRVDIGASYFTVPDGSAFAGVVGEWMTRGLVRPWTDTFAVADDTRLRDRTTGPMRFAAPGGLRGLVADLAESLNVEHQRTVETVEPGALDGESVGDIVLAMPDPQANRLLPASHEIDAVEWEPVIAVILGFAERSWPADLQGAFVNDSATVGFIADDGARRGDGAPVLVAHTTSALAAAHLDDPHAVRPIVVDAVRRIFGITDEPEWVAAHRWTFARPATTHAQPFSFVDGIGVCGDAWGASPSVSTAWASGDALGRAIAASR
ncbi:NAD(P)/FAD-dependent oxidoreductase [Agromyces atrinae]|uniref:NAD/FAD-dependent oxidoreductase n=1 Tax=Agromyces atrinae TaxID=592376 RepID=A0A4Q2MAD9_9MICO|nr:FAD-dependent oxidoreductase [Agromyces atrinae]NYD68658.1 hypothetical protein [Agromyces atrinae]RXZ86030.1 NAD/FAD-dependent oxidoreductase [Agromyces atrinae]